MTFKYTDNSKLTREEIIDQIIEDRSKGLKTWSLEKQLRLKDEVPENKAKDYYNQLNRYIAIQVADNLQEV